MRLLKSLTILLTVAAVTAAATAQPTGAPKVDAAEAVKAVKAMLPAEPVIKHIPAGVMGFVAVNNLKASTGRVDQFLKDIGVWDMLSLPEGGTLTPVEGMLGEGFNPNGGLAVVMLDAQQYGIDLPKLVMPQQAADGGEAEEAKEEPKLPFVMFLAGSSVEDVLTKFQPEKDGDFYKVMMPPGPMYAAKQGGYVIVSPNTKALKAIQAGGAGNVTKELTKDQLQAVTESDIAVHVNMKVTGPVLSEFLKQLEKQMAEMKEMMAEGHGGMAMGPMGMMTMYADLLPMYREMLGQMQGMTMAGRFVKTGLVFEQILQWDPASEYGKAMAGFKAPKGDLVGRLPNNPYVLAVGAGMQMDESTRALGVDMIGKWLSGLDKETLDRVKKLTDAFYQEAEQMQIVIGGAPKGSGVFGMACVLRCKDSEKVKALLAEKTTLIKPIIKGLIPQVKEEEDFEALKIEYNKAVEKVAGLDIDTVEITHPEMAEMPDREKEEMTKALGEAKVRFFVAAPDKNTVVVTFGGYKPFLEEALKVAKSGEGTILKDEAASEAMKHMPKNLASLVLLNGANLYQVIVEGAKTMEPGAEDPAFEVACKTPVAIGSGVSGSSQRTVVYIPSALVKDGVGLVGTPFSRAMAPSMHDEPAPREGEEF